MRWKQAFVLVAFLAVLIGSVALMRLPESPYKISLDLLSQKLPPPRANAFPSADQRVIYGTSNVWEDPELSLHPDAHADEVLHEAARNVFVLLKTGAETMWNRIPVHFDTSLKRFPNHAIYSDMGAMINGHEVIDALQYLPTWALNSDQLLGYRVRRTSIDEHWGWGPAKVRIGDGRGGWELDRYKNIPAFAHAWQLTRGTMPWYLMIDGDTYIPTTTIAAATKDRNPDEIWYIGHGVGANPVFAHGGSGILLSRGAMRAMFREPSDTAWHAELIDDACQRAVPDCCGDSIVAYEYERLTSNRPEANLEIEENGMFQGNPKGITRLDPNMWCTPVGSFHHITSWEIQELFEWERIALLRKAAKGSTEPLTYADFFDDFVDPFLSARRPGWHFRKPNMPLRAITYDGGSSDVWDGETKLDPVNVEADCTRACELSDLCLSWQWQKGKVCEISQGEFALGFALNPYGSNWEEGFTETAAGHMIERIRNSYASSQCRSATVVAPEDSPQHAGWYNEWLEKELSDHKIVHQLESRPLLVNAESVKEHSEHESNR